MSPIYTDLLCFISQFIRFLYYIMIFIHIPLQIFQRNSVASSLRTLMHSIYVVLLQTTYKNCRYRRLIHHPYLQFPVCLFTIRLASFDTSFFIFKIYFTRSLPESSHPSVPVSSHFRSGILHPSEYLLHPQHCISQSAPVKNS